MQSDNCTVMVRNLDEKVDEELLYELFLQAGPVDHVRFPGSFGVSANYAFVTFLHEESVPYSIKLLESTSLYGRTIYIKDAANRQSNYPQRPPPPPNPRSNVKDRLGTPVSTKITSSLEVDPHFGRKRYNDLSMQPSTKHHKNLHRDERDSWNCKGWEKPPEFFYPYSNNRFEPSRRHGRTPEDYSHSHSEHRSKQKHGDYPHRRKSYERSPYQMDSHRYENRPYRRSK